MHHIIVQYLCSAYRTNLLERLILNRIQSTIDSILPINQAGFRENRGCVEQVLALTTYIEKGFQRNLKTSVALLDLTAAYDTVWREGLLFKFMKLILCLKLSNLLNSMLTNRYYRVFLGDK